MKRIRQLWILLALAAAASGCGGDKGESPNKQITIRIVSFDDGSAVADAYVHGGFDWTRFDATTDSGGYAQLPAYAANLEAGVVAMNHYPRLIRIQAGTEYGLGCTAVELRWMGSSNLYPVKFVKDTLIHLDYNGDLVTFLYSHAGMTEAAHVPLAPLRRQAILVGDTLWFTTNDKGVYAYDIANPASPRLLLHLPIDEYLGPIAVVDSLVIVANHWEAGPVEIYVFRPDGSWSLLTKWGELWVERLEVKNGALIIYGHDDPALTILSIDDPAHPQELFSWGNPYYQGTFRVGDSVVFIPAVGLYSEGYIHLILDISNPTSPIWRGNLISEARLEGLPNDTMAVGSYQGQPALLAGNLGQGYRVVGLALSGGDPSVLVPGASLMVGDFALIDFRLWEIVR